MAASLVAPRYSAEDFETTSIHSAAPSYVSDAPSYHSNPPYQEPVPPYAPRENQTTSGAATRNNRGVDRDRPVAQQQTIGLPPVPPAPPIGVPNLHNFRIPTWSTRNAPAARQLHSVIERRVNAGMGTGGPGSSSSSNSSTGFMPRRYQGTPDRPAPEQSSSSSDQSEEHILRPLEDPYLVGERAAEAAKRERLARERGDDILQREDKQWDWLLEQMKSWEERERSFARFRREVDTSRRGKLLRRMGGRMI